LCSVTAKDRNLTIDTTLITIDVKKKTRVPAAETIYNAVLNIFGVFADGAPVKLNIEVKVVINTSSKKTYLVIITSPRKKDDPVWAELYAIQKRFVVPE